MQFNQQTRSFYDQDQTRLRILNSEKPLKWYTTDSQQNKTLEYANLNDIDVSTKLSRAPPTRLNHFNRSNTELYGTAPFIARNKGPVDVESSLQQGDKDGFNSCNKQHVTEYNTFNYNVGEHANTMYAGLPLKVLDDRVGLSTRNTQIKYGNSR